MSELTAFQKLQELSGSIQEIEFGGETHFIKPFTYREGKEFLAENKGRALDDVYLNACVESFVDDELDRICENQTFNTLKALIEELPGGFVSKVSVAMLTSSFGEDYLDHFPPVDPEEDLTQAQEVTIDGDGRNVAAA